MSDLNISTDSLAIGDEIEITTSEAVLSNPSSPVLEQATSNIVSTAAMAPGATLSTEAAKNSQTKQKRKYVRKVPLQKKTRNESMPRKRTSNPRVKTSESSSEEKANFASVDTVESAASGSTAEAQDPPKANVGKGTKGRGRPATGRARNRSASNRGEKRNKNLTVPVASSIITSTSLNASISTEVPVTHTAATLPKIKPTEENVKKVPKVSKLSTIMEASLDAPQEPEPPLLPPKEVVPEKENPVVTQNEDSVAQLSVGKKTTTTIVPVNEPALSSSSDSDIFSLNIVSKTALQPNKKTVTFGSQPIKSPLPIPQNKIFFTVSSPVLNRSLTNSVKLASLKNRFSFDGVESNGNSVPPAISTSQPSVELPAASTHKQQTNLAPRVNLLSDLDRNSKRATPQESISYETDAKRLCSRSNNADRFAPYSYGSLSAMTSYYRRPSPLFSPMYPNLAYDADGDNQFLSSIATYLEMVHRDDKLVVRQRIMDVLIDYQKNMPFPPGSRQVFSDFKNPNRMTNNKNCQVSAAAVSVEASAPSSQEEVNLLYNQDIVEEEEEEMLNNNVDMIYDSSPGPSGLNRVSNEGDNRGNVVQRTSLRGNKGVPPGRFGHGEYVSYDS